MFRVSNGWPSDRSTGMPPVTHREPASSPSSAVTAMPERIVGLDVVAVRA